MSTNAPKIRFKGFTHAWEQRKLGEVAERVTRKNNNLQSTRPLTISAQHGLVDQTEFFSKQIASRDVSNYFLLKNGEFAYNKSYSNGYPWGAIKRLDFYDMGVLSTLYIVFSPTDIESEFLLQYYETELWHKEVSVCAAEGARNHGLLNISTSDFFNTLLKNPTDKAEQIAIGNFFRTLDDAITLHKRKLDGLKELKAGYLQQMFPQAGESAPRVRFNGVCEDWKEKKLGEVGETFTGLSGKTKEDFGHGNAEFITYKNVFSNAIANLTQTEPIEVDTAQHEVEYGDVLFTTSSETPEEVGMSSIWFGDRANVYLNSFCFGYRPESSFEPHFLAFLLRSPKVRQEFVLLAQGISRYNISKTKAMEISIRFPTYTEQVIIGKFFYNLDEQIITQQNKIEQLQQLKTAYLQKMFI